MGHKRYDYFTTAYKAYVIKVVKLTVNFVTHAIDITWIIKYYFYFMAAYTAYVIEVVMGFPYFFNTPYKLRIIFFF